MAQTTANAIADYIIKCCRDRGELITNLHLQKLVYYAQAWYLALYDKPLFDEEFQSWISGPVQPELHDRFKSYKWNPISERKGRIAKACRRAYARSARGLWSAQFFLPGKDDSRRRSVAQSPSWNTNR